MTACDLLVRAGLVMWFASCVEGGVADTPPSSSAGGGSSIGHGGGGNGEGTAPASGGSGGSGLVSSGASGGGGAVSSTGATGGGGANVSSAEAVSASSTGVGGSDSGGAGANGGLGAGGSGTTGGNDSTSATGGTDSTSATGGPGGAGAGNNPLRVLFVGNSFTYHWDVPGQLAALGQAANEPVALDLGTVVSAGQTLQGHYESGDVLAALDAKTWDLVVLQEHAAWPVAERDLFFHYAELLDLEIKAHGAVTMLFITWVDQAQTAADQSAVTLSYLDLAQQLSDDVVPIGPAFQNAFGASAGIALHAPDGFHANGKGSYLAACTFYAALYGKSPEGLPATNAEVGGDAALLQSAAWTTWNAGGWSF